MKKLLLAASACLVLLACERTDNKTTRNAADNTERNVRDRTGDTLTPGDQSETESDRTITRNIRRSLMDDNTLSTNAKNVKIITINGVVTLRGAVNTDAEKARIGQKAQVVSGVQTVDNLLDVTNIQ